MDIKRSFPILCISIFMHLFGIAQKQFVCGTHDIHLVKEQMLINRAELRDFVNLRDDITYVPVKIFLVADNEGNGRLNEESVLDLMCTLNQNYADQNIQFYIKDGFSYMNNTTIYNNPSGSFAASLIRNARKLNAINIFFTEGASEGSAAYYQGPTGFNDWIVVRNNYADDVRVVTHEIGHFFSVPHPFNGWDDEPWDSEKHGNPVGKYAPDKVTINEFADGSNCNPNLAQNNNNVGDGICDTPADYNFASSNCDYTLDARDPNGAKVTPQENNYMNYFFGCDNYVFTNGQKTEISRSLNSSSRDYLRSNYQPNTMIIDQVTELISPQNQESLISDNEVVLKWTKSNGADYYLVELDVSPSIDFSPESYITTEDNIYIDGLLPEKNYFWRVTPFNEYYTCTSRSEIRRFKTSKTSAINELPFVRHLNIYPSVLPKNNNQINILIDTELSFQAHFQLFGLQGKRYHQWPILDFIPGRNYYELNIPELASGMYVLNLQSAKGSYSTKILVH